MSVSLQGERGIIMTRIHRQLGIHRHLILKITAEELELRRAHQGETCSTTEVQDHLECLCPSKTLGIEEFRIEWLPQALNDLETIWKATNPPPPPHRQHAAVIKLVKNS